MFKSFILFKVEVFVLSTFKNSLYISDNSHSSEMSFTNTLSQSRDSLSLTVFFSEQFLILMSVLLTNYLFHGLGFQAVSKKSSAYPELFRFSPTFMILHFKYRFGIENRLMVAQGGEG